MSIMIRIPDIVFSIYFLFKGDIFFFKGDNLSGSHYTDIGNFTTILLTTQQLINVF